MDLDLKSEIQCRIGFWILKWNLDLKSEIQGVVGFGSYGFGSEVWIQVGFWILKIRDSNFGFGFMKSPNRTFKDGSGF